MGFGSYELVDLEWKVLRESVKLIIDFNSNILI